MAYNFVTLDEHLYAAVARLFLHHIGQAARAALQQRASAGRQDLTDWRIYSSRKEYHYHTANGMWVMAMLLHGPYDPFCERMCKVLEQIYGGSRNALEVLALQCVPDEYVAE